LVDEHVPDGLAALAALDGTELTVPARGAADLRALVAGQDVEEGDDGPSASLGKWPRRGSSRLSTPRPATGTSSAKRRFDGYKAHCDIGTRPSRPRFE